MCYIGCTRLYTAVHDFVHSCTRLCTRLYTTLYTAVHDFVHGYPLSLCCCVDQTVLLKSKFNEEYSLERPYVVDYEQAVEIPCLVQHDAELTPNVTWLHQNVPVHPELGVRFIKQDNTLLINFKGMNDTNKRLPNLGECIVLFCWLCILLFSCDNEMRKTSYSSLFLRISYTALHTAFEMRWDEMKSLCMKAKSVLICTCIDTCVVHDGLMKSPLMYQVTLRDPGVALRDIKITTRIWLPHFPHNYVHTFGEQCSCWKYEHMSITF